MIKVEAPGTAIANELLLVTRTVKILLPEEYYTALRREEARTLRKDEGLCPRCAAPCEESKPLPTDADFLCQECIEKQAEFNKLIEEDLEEEGSNGSD